jgi:hypothetical protein
MAEYELLEFRGRVASFEELMKRPERKDGSLTNPVRPPTERAQWGLDGGLPAPEAPQLSFNLPGVTASADERPVMAALTGVVSPPVADVPVEVSHVAGAEAHVPTEIADPAQMQLSPAELVAARLRDTPPLPADLQESDESSEDEMQDGSRTAPAQPLSDQENQDPDDLDQLILY